MNGVISWLIKGNGYEAWQTLLYVFVGIFGLDHAQTTIGFEMCWSNWSIETFLLRYSAVVWTLKRRIVHGGGPSNINCSTILVMARFHNWLWWYVINLYYGACTRHWPYNQYHRFCLDRMHPSHSGLPIRRLALWGYILWLQDDDQADIYAVYNPNRSFPVPESYPVISGDFASTHF